MLQNICNTTHDKEIIIYFYLKNPIKIKNQHFKPFVGYGYIHGTKHHELKKCNEPLHNLSNFNRIQP
jgi:hypothetical protein